VPPAPAVDWKARLEEIEGRRQRLEGEITKRRAELEKKTAPKKIVVKREHANDMRVLFGHPVEASVVRDGAVVGKVRATVRTSEAVTDVLRRSPRRKGEVPFAVDSKGKVYTATPEDASRLKSIGLADPRRGSATVPGWAVARALDPDSGLTFGVARPFHDSLEQVRRTAGRNFVYGLALIGLALLGIVPVANHMARDVERVTAGAERIAHGDLDTEVPVTSRNEVGRLAATFNRMARDLKDHQRRLLEEERQRREREVEQRVLKTEYDRKSEELEQARRFQLSLLPKTLPRHERFDIAVYMKTATEVGGDYYDFHLDDDGSLTAVVGDATGHGAAAGTMVTVVKSLFSAWSGHLDLRRFLAEAATTIKRMDLGRMAMALQIARIVGDRLTIASAGMPPALVYRAAAGAVEEIALAGTPLGTLTFDYESSESSLKSGDVVLLMSDGFPELLSGSGEPLGYPRVEEVFATVARRSAGSIIEALAAAAAEWSGSEVPNDDVTFVVVKMT
jgi:serine phosphatase RsbU (regulator of sigma subunit)